MKFHELHQLMHFPRDLEGLCHEKIVRTVNQRFLLTTRQMYSID
jgi:hypothetical protein